MDNNCKTINERVRWIRELLGMTQDEFASSVYRTRSEIKNIEYDKTTPKSEVIQAICDTYNLNPDWIKNGEGAMFVDAAPEGHLVDIATSSDTQSVMILAPGVDFSHLSDAEKETVYLSLQYQLHKCQALLERLTAAGTAEPHGIRVQVRRKRRR